MIDKIKAKVIELHEELKAAIAFRMEAARCIGGDVKCICSDIKEMIIGR